MSQLSPPIQAVLELFQGPLAELRFADVDAGALAHLASAVEAASSAVAEQEAQLSDLRQTLADRQDALLLLAQRALAYARVYAEQDEALTEQLLRITLPRAGKPRKASAKAVGAEPSAVDPEPSVVHDLAATEGVAQPAAEAGADSNTEAMASDASDPSTPDTSDASEASTSDASELNAQPPRKGKRRTSVPRGDAHSGSA